MSLDDGNSLLHGISAKTFLNFEATAKQGVIKKVGPIGSMDRTRWSVKSIKEKALKMKGNLDEDCVRNAVNAFMTTVPVFDGYQSNEGAAQQPTKVLVSVLQFMRYRRTCL